MRRAFERKGALSGRTAPKGNLLVCVCRLIRAHGVIEFLGSRLHLIDHGVVEVDKLLAGLFRRIVAQRLFFRLQTADVLAALGDKALDRLLGF